MTKLCGTKVCDKVVLCVTGERWWLTKLCGTKMGGGGGGGGGGGPG